MFQQNARCGWPHTYIPDFYLNNDRPTRKLRDEYADKPAFNHPTRVRRRARSSAAYSGICSTQFNYVDVTLPRIPTIDGRYIEEAINAA